MKKILTLACFMAVVGVVAASAQIVWGGRVGLCYSTATFSSDYDNDNSGTISGEAGLEVGPVLYYALKENIYLNTSAMFSIKNFAEGAESLDLYYLEVPLYIGYAFPVSGLDFYAQAGPYAGFKIGESTSSSGQDGSGVGSFNAGLGLAAGININRFKVELGYQEGLTNIFEGEAAQYAKLTIGSMFIGVSYIF
jgi:hypothetical protein